MDFFRKSLDDKNEKFREMRQEHESWKSELMAMNKPFFMVPTDFSHLFLKDISGGALKLYLFLGFHSKYRSGESWYTNDQIGMFFEKDSRTITKWFKELENIGLIFRAQKGVMMKANTFLRPFGFFIDEQKSYFDAKVKDIQLHLNTAIEDKLVPVQSLVLNSGIQETSLVIIYKSENLYPISCYFDFEFQDIKEIRAIFKKFNIPIENFEIDVPLAYSKYSSQVIYKNIIKYFDENSMW